MNADEWQKINDLLLQATAFDVAEQQHQFVRKNAPNTFIYDEVMSLLAAMQCSEEFLEKPIGETTFPPVPKLKNLEQGTRIGDFTILELIGVGGIARVYLAHQHSLSRSVALKTSLRGSGEAKTLAQLNHQNIVTIYSEGTFDTDDVYYICMEYIAGPNLAKFIESPATGDSLTAKQWMTGLEQLADALIYAHSKEVLHLDIKPENILIDGLQNFHLTDFNVSFAHHLKDSDDKARGGTPLYMAPEHADAFFSFREGKSHHSEVDGRADIYSFGCLMKDFFPKIEKVVSQPQFEMLTALCQSCKTDSVSERIQTTQEVKDSLRFISNLDKYSVPRGSWIRASLHAPLLSLIFVVLVPQFIGSIFNILYNSITIVSQLDVTQREAFGTYVAVYNSIVYPIGVGIFAWRASVIRHIGKPLAIEVAQHIQKRLLQAPLISFGVASLGWLPGCFFFPVALDASSTPLPSQVYLHFNISIILSWLISTSYGVIFAQVLVLTTLYPLLVTRSQNAWKIAPPSFASSRIWLQIWFGLSVTIPIAAAGLIIYFGPEGFSQTQYQSFRILIIGVLLLSLVGIPIAQRLTSFALRRTWRYEEQTGSFHN